MNNKTASAPSKTTSPTEMTLIKCSLNGHVSKRLWGAVILASDFSALRVLLSDCIKDAILRWLIGRSGCDGGERRHESYVMKRATLTLPPLEAAGFLLHPRLPAVAGLTPGPQAFYFPCAPRRRYKVDARHFPAWFSTGNYQGRDQLNMFFSVLGFTHRTPRWNRQRRVSKNFERAHYRAKGRCIEEGAALRVASRRAKFIPSLEVRSFLWLSCNRTPHFYRSRSCRGGDAPKE